jgi:hypothetical protein
VADSVGVPPRVSASHPTNWTVQLTPEAQAWLSGLGTRDAHKIHLALEALEREGPALGRPRVGFIETSRHHNMKELRSVGGHLRALFAFDPQRRAIVLVGGDKQDDWKGWYKRNIPVADKLYDRHLRSEGEEARWRSRAPRTGERSEEIGR